MKPYNKPERPVSLSFIVCIFLGVALLTVVILFIPFVNDFILSLQGIISKETLSLILLLFIAVVTLGAIALVRIIGSKHTD